MANGILKMSGIGSSMEIIKARADLQYENGASKPPLKFPEYFTGARAVVYVNDSKVAACMSVSWSVEIDHSELRTVDSNLPWELIPGQIGISAKLRRFINPDRTAAGDHLFTIVQAALHTPTATLEVRDRLGNVMFLAKGSFTSLSGEVAVGAAGIEEVGFKGYYWRQNDQQYFDPDISSRDPLEQLKSIGRAKVGAINAMANFITGKGVL